MATFIPGLTDYIPQFQNDIPDLGLIQQTLKIKQSQYDANYAKIKSIQDSILNAPLSRDDTKETRKAFFEAADKAIKQISTVDLSKAQNISVAERIFDPLLNNQLFKKDAAVTNIVMSEAKKGQEAKDCADPKKCNDAYNPESDEALNYWLENFKNMTPEQALNATPRRYVYDPKINEKLLAYVKEIAPDGEVSNIGGASGEYIITTKMGPKVQQELNLMLQSMVANDPQIAEYLGNKAYVTRERYIRSTATPESGISREQANKQYDNENISVIQKNYDDTILSIDEIIKNKKEESNALAASQGNKITEGSSIFKELEQRASDIKQYQIAKDALDQKRVAFNDRVQKGISSSFIDDNYTNQLLQTMVSNFSSGYAAQKFSQKIETNDIWLNEKKFNQDVYMEQLKFNNQASLKGIQAKLDKQLKEWEMSSGYKKAGKGKGESSEGEEGDDDEYAPKYGPIFSGTGAGAATVVLNNVNEYNVAEAMKVQNMANAAKLKVLQDLSATLDPEARNIIFAKPGGGVYTNQEIQNLYGPTGLQRVPGDNTKSMLDVIYKKVNSVLKTSPVINKIPAQILSNVVSIQSEAEDYENAARASLEVVTNNQKRLYAKLQKNPEYLELFMQIRNTPGLQSVIKAEKDLDGNNMIVIDANELAKRLPKVPKENTNLYGNQFADYILEQSNTKTNKTVELITHPLVKKLNTLIGQTIGSVKQDAVSSTNFNLDKLGQPTLSINSMGYSEPIINTSSSKATQEAKNFFNTVNQSIQGGDPIVVRNETGDVTTDAGRIIDYISSIYYTPKKSNPLGVGSLTRSENLDEKNEWSANKSTYATNIPTTLQAQIAKDLNMDISDIPNTLYITVPSEIDRSVNIARKSIDTDPITLILNTKGNYTKTIKNPLNSNNKIDIQLYKTGNNIIAEMRNNGELIPGMAFNLTTLNKPPSIFVNEAVLQANLYLSTNKEESAKQVTTKSGQVNQGTVYTNSDLKSMGLTY